MYEDCENVLGEPGDLGLALGEKEYVYLLFERGEPAGFDLEPPSIPLTLSVRELSFVALQGLIRLIVPRSSPPKGKSSLRTVMYALSVT